MNDWIELLQHDVTISAPILCLLWVVQSGEHLSSSGYTIDLVRLNSALHVCCCQETHIFTGYLSALCCNRGSSRPCFHYRLHVSTLAPCIAFVCVTHCSCIELCSAYHVSLCWVISQCNVRAMQHNVMLLHLFSCSVFQTNHYCSRWWRLVTCVHWYYEYAV